LPSTCGTSTAAIFRSLHCLAQTPAYLSAIIILSSLLKAELTEREVHSLAYQMKVRASRPTET
jgi:hypothetical protein